MAVAVLFRPDTITESKLLLFDQMVRHGGCLIPAIMTVLDIGDALSLSSHVERRAIHIKQQAASVRGGLGLDHRLSLHLELSQLFSFHNTSQLSQCFVVGGSLLSIIVGLGLFIFSLQSFTTQSQICQEMIGKVAFCARPRLYYRFGFFENTVCGFEKIETINCREDMKHALSDLPDCIDCYKNMSSLSFINISNKPNLINAPKGFGYLTNPSGVKIILKNNPKMSMLPYVVCTNNVTREIDLSGTLARKDLDWSNNQIEGNNPEQIYINKACQDELFPHVKTISLANNSLECTITVNDNPTAPAESHNCGLDLLRISDFKSLNFINFSHNNFTAINSLVVGATAKVLINHKTDFDGKDGGLSFVGNNISKFMVVGQPLPVTLSWINGVIFSEGTNLKLLDLSASQVTWAQFSSSNIMSFIPSLGDLTLTGLPW